MIGSRWTGVITRVAGCGRAGRGGDGGRVDLRTEDPDPGKAVSSYRGIKGKHETYFRAIHVLTPQAAWRAAFEFEESLDNAANGVRVGGEVGHSFESIVEGVGKVDEIRDKIFAGLDAVK